MLSLDKHYLSHFWAKQKILFGGWGGRAPSEITKKTGEKVNSKHEFNKSIGPQDKNKKRNVPQDYQGWGFEVGGSRLRV